VSIQIRKDIQELKLDNQKEHIPNFWKAGTVERSLRPWILEWTIMAELLVEKGTEL